MRNQLLALPLVVLALATLLPPVAVGEETVAVTAYVAPWGWIIESSEKIEVKALRVGDTSIYWSASGNRLLLPVDPRKATLVTPSGTLELETKGLKDFAVVVDTGSTRILIHSSYLTRFTIVRAYVGQVPPEKPPTGTIVLLGAYAPGYPVGKQIVILTGSEVTVYYPNGTVSTQPVHKAFNIPEHCISFTESGLWIGGLVAAPECLLYARPVAITEPVNGLYPVIKLETTEDNVIVSFGGYPEVLKKFNIMTMLSDVVQTYWTSLLHVYVVNDPIFFPDLTPIPTVVAETVHVEVEGERVCKPPEGAEIVAAVTWGTRGRNFNEPFKLMPLEVFLFRRSNSFYVCYGDLSYLEVYPTYEVKGWKELPGPLVVEHGVTVTGDGDVLEPPTEIPPSTWTTTSIVVVGSWATLVEPSPPSLLMNPMMLPVYGAVVTAVIAVAATGRGRKERIVRFEFDVAPPEPYTVASKTEIFDAIRRHVDTYGFCPTMQELIIHHELLPPLDIEQWPPDRDEPICPWGPGGNEEHAMRKVVELLSTYFWSVKRLSRNLAVARTLVGPYRFQLIIWSAPGKDIGKEVVQALTEIHRQREKVKQVGHVISLGIVYATSSCKAAKNLQEKMETLSRHFGRGREAIDQLVNEATRGHVPDEVRAVLSDRNNPVMWIVPVCPHTLHQLIDYVAEAYLRHIFQTKTGRKREGEEGGQT